MNTLVSPAYPSTALFHATCALCLLHCLLLAGSCDLAMSAWPPRDTGSLPVPEAGIDLPAGPDAVADTLVCDASGSLPVAFQASAAGRPGAGPALVRLRPATPAQMAWTMEHLGQLSQVPPDRSIRQGGTRYDDPAVDEGRESPWLHGLASPDILAALQDQGISHEILGYLPGPADPAAAPGSKGGTSSNPLAGRLARPSGRVLVWDAINSSWKPVRHARVVASQWATVAQSQTDSNGNFRIAQVFGSQLGPVRLTVVFQNAHASIHRLPTEHLLQFFWPAEYVHGDIPVSRLAGLTIRLPDGSLAARLATVLNAVEEYRDYAGSKGITLPDQLKVVTFGNSGGGLALMGRYSCLAPATLLAGGNWLGGVLLQSQLPDLLVGLANQPGEAYNLAISKTTYHECAHASHFKEVGDLYWWQDNLEILDGWLDQLLAGTAPGNLDAYNQGSSELTCLKESWAWLAGYTILAATNPGIAQQVVGNYLEHPASYGYLYHDGFHDLMDQDDEPGDSCSGYRLDQIFQVLTDPRVKSAQAWYQQFCQEQCPGNPAEMQRVRATLSLAGARLR